MFSVLYDGPRPLVYPAVSAGNRAACCTIFATLAFIWNGALLAIFPAADRYASISAGDIVNAPGCCRTRASNHQTAETSTRRLRAPADRGSHCCTQPG